MPVKHPLVKVHIDTTPVVECKEPIRVQFVSEPVISEEASVVVNEEPCSTVFTPFQEIESADL